jgi:hypothetical protein
MVESRYNQHLDNEFVKVCSYLLSLELTLLRIVVIVFSPIFLATSTFSPDFLSLSRQYINEFVGMSLAVEQVSVDLSTTALLVRRIGDHNHAHGKNENDNEENTKGVDINFDAGRDVR